MFARMASVHDVLLLFALSCSISLVSLRELERQSRDEVGVAIGATIIRLDNDTMEPPPLPPNVPAGDNSVPGVTCLGVLDVPPIPPELLEGGAQAGPKGPPAPPPPDGPNTPSPDELEGGGGGKGSLGDRCPFPADENGEWPDFCYDVVDLETGDCLLDDIVADKDLCIMMFNESYYNHLVELQKQFEQERPKAVQQHLHTIADQIASAIAGTITANVHNKKENNKGKGKGNNGNKPNDGKTPQGPPHGQPQGSPQNSPVDPVPPPVNENLGPISPYSPGTGPIVPVAGPNIMPIPAITPVNGAGKRFADSRNTPSTRRRSDGPKMNVDVLNQLGYMKNKPTGAPKPLIGHQKRGDEPKTNQKRGGPLGPDGPRMNLNALSNSGYMEKPPTGAPKPLIGHEN